MTTPGPQPALEFREKRATQALLWLSSLFYLPMILTLYVGIVGLTLSAKPHRTSSVQAVLETPLFSSLAFGAMLMIFISILIYATLKAFAIGERVEQQFPSRFVPITIIIWVILMMPNMTAKGGSLVVSYALWLIKLLG